MYTKTTAYHTDHNLTAIWCCLSVSIHLLALVLGLSTSGDKDHPSVVCVQPSTVALGPLGITAIQINNNYNNSHSKEGEIVALSGISDLPKVT